MDSLIDYLPEDCLYHVLSLTFPRDAYNFSLTATRFRSVVNSDVMWQAFLPSDFVSILSRVVNPVMFTSKKDLFFKLSKNHVLIDRGTMSFGLEISSGAKCYMISTSLLKIASTDTHYLYWRRISHPDSRFAEVVERIFPVRLNIVGKIDSKSLSSNTRYGAYLVYKLTKTCRDISYSIGRMRQQTSVTVGRQIRKSTVYLEPFYVKYTSAKEQFDLNRFTFKGLFEKSEFDNNVEITAKERDDGWIEVEMGTFYVDKEEDGEVEMKLQSIEGSLLENMIIVQGIEIRPKH
ncbi:F-box protein VBF-like [Carex rostrata]